MFALHAKINGDHLIITIYYEKLIKKLFKNLCLIKLYVE